MATSFVRSGWVKGSKEGRITYRLLFNISRRFKLVDLLKFVSCHTFELLLNHGVLAAVKHDCQSMNTAHLIKGHDIVNLSASIVNDWRRKQLTLVWPWSCAVDIYSTRDICYVHWDVYHTEHCIEPQITRNRGDNQPACDSATYVPKANDLTIIMTIFAFFILEALSLINLDLVFFFIIWQFSLIEECRFSWRLRSNYQNLGRRSFWNKLTHWF